MTRVAATVACALLIASCRGNATNIVLSSLDRSEKIDLLCADVEQLTGNLYDLKNVLPLELCDDDIDFAPDVIPQFLGSVTQTESGTLAVLNFSNNATFDTNRTVPGVTALKVGEQPTAVQVSPVDSRYTYVTSFSPKSLQAISTREVITGSPIPPDRNQDGEPDGLVLPREEIRFDAGPTDLALYELASVTSRTQDANGQVTGATTDVAYRFLYVAIPDLGRVVQVQVDIDDATGEQRLGAITDLVLPTYDCDTVTAVPPPPSDETDYNRICPEDFQDRPGRFVKTVETTTPCISGAMPGPRPVALEIDMGRPDALDEVLLVADANQPVIHRFELFATGATALEPLVTLTPATHIAVTPYVPATSDQDDRAAVQRYVYAVTAGDGSVFAIDYTDTSATFGAVLPVVAGVSPRANEETIESRNRVRSSFSNARDIEVISPFYELETGPDGQLLVAEGDEETEICDPTDPDAFALAQNPRNMRGVFLAVSLSNGTMFFLDVYDLNAPCRGGEGAIACTLAETGADQFASIRRHRRRFGFTPTTFISIDGTPSLQFNAAPGLIDETNGEAANSDGPDLEFIECPESMFNVFGVPPAASDADGLICASSQVWSSFTQRWDARWQGLIPDSEGGLGLFSEESYQGEAGNWFLAGDVPFCRVGVIGEQSGTPEGSGLAIDTLRAYGGDRLVITGELPPNTQDDEACKRSFEDLEEDIDDRQVWFPIIRAFNDQLEIGEAPEGANYTLAETARCFNQFTEYQIHTRDAYTVVGTTSGFINAVVPDETTGECIFDPARVDPATGFPPLDPDDVDTYLTGRTFPDTQFVNPLVSFEIGPFDSSLILTDSTVTLLSFNILNQFGVELLDTGGNRRSLPGSMLFAPEREQLFFVDFHAGVRRIVFSPLSIVQTFE